MYRFVRVLLCCASLVNIRYYWCALVPALLASPVVAGERVAERSVSRIVITVGLKAGDEVGTKRVEAWLEEAVTGTHLGHGFSWQFIRIDRPPPTGYEPLRVLDIPLPVPVPLGIQLIIAPNGLNAFAVLSPFSRASCGGLFSEDATGIALLSLSDDGKKVSVASMSTPKGLDTRLEGLAPKVLAALPKGLALYERGGPVAVAPKGTRLAYACLDGRSWSVVVDGRTAGSGYSEVTDVVMSQGGQHVAWAALKGKADWVIAVDGQEKATPSPISAVGLSPDGQRVAYSQQKGSRWLVVSDGKAGPAYQAIGRIAVTADGRIAYAAKKAKKHWLVVVGTNEGPEYDRIGGGSLFPFGRYKFEPRHGYWEGDGGLTGGGGPRFAEGDKVTYLAWKGNIIYQVEQPASQNP
jgi:hypothetical protein